MEQRRGYEWSWKLSTVANMLRYLTRVIREDIGFDDGATLASMALLDRAMLYFQLELQDGGTKEGREDCLENQLRIQEALRCLDERFDDIHMRRLRALQIAECAARLTSIPSDGEVEDRLDKITERRALDDDELARHRDWMVVDQPAMSGVMWRKNLADVDERFLELDPLVVLEEFSDASAETSGGRTEGGDGRTGPVRALARLSVMCAALDFQQRAGEEFDAAVERARNNLIVTRSRIRRAVRTFPGRRSDDNEGGDQRSHSDEDE